MALSMARKRVVKMEQLEPMLRELAAQLGTTVEYLWGVMITQAHVYVLSYIVYLVLFFLVFFITYKLIKNLANEADDDLECMQIPQFILIVVLCFGLVAGTIGLTIEFSNFLTALLNPEYWALQQILEYIR